MNLEGLNTSAFRLLTSVDVGVYTLSEIAAKLDKQETTAYNTVKILKKAGFIEVDKRKGLYKVKAVLKIQAAEDGDLNITDEMLEKKKEKDSQADEVLGYLNKKAGKNFRMNAGNRRYVIYRLNEGFTINDIKKVIDYKCLDWKSDERMNQYLRPQTLFGPKFESYLNGGSPYDDLSEKMDEVMNASYQAQHDDDFYENIDF